MEQAWRETRSRKSDAEIRQDGERRTITGHAATFGDWYAVDNFEERIAPGAFDDVLGHDVVALVNHDMSSVPLGRTLSGTLRLSVDDKGLRYDIDPPQSAERELEAVARGDMPFSSFAFEVAEEEWEFGANGAPDRRTITKIKRLWDVSIVTHPANQNAEVAVRNRDHVFARQAKTGLRARKLRMLQLRRRSEV
jgi:HK97 family phage prohead protease